MLRRVATGLALGYALLVGLGAALAWKMNKDREAFSP